MNKNKVSLFVPIFLVSFACSTAQQLKDVKDQQRIPAASNPAAPNPCEKNQNLLPLDCFAETGYLDEHYIPHLWDLASADYNNYPKIFNQSEPPTLEEFRGSRMNGLIIYVNAWEVGKLVFVQYTGSNWDLVTNKLYSRMLTFQKRFYDKPNDDGESGLNFWPVRGVEAMPMKIYLSDMLGEKEGSRYTTSLKIDYDVESNNSLERPLLDEVRRIPGSNLYIGKIFVRKLGKNNLFLWFDLEKVEPKTQINE